MSWLGDVWKRNKKAVGNFVKNISPAVAFIPGIGPLAAAGLAGLGSVAGDTMISGKLGGSGVLRRALTNAGLAGTASGFGAGKVFGGGKPPIAPPPPTASAGPGGLSLTPDNITASLQGAAPPPLSLAPSPVGSAASSAAAPASQGGNFLSRVGTSIKDNPLPWAMAGSGALNAASTQQQMAQEADQFDRTQGLEESKFKSLQAQQDAIAQLLAPLYEQVYRQYLGNQPSA